MSLIKVGMDISQTAFSGGVGVYTKNLAHQLEKIEDLRMKFFYSSLRRPYKGDLKGVKTSILPPLVTEIIFNQIRVVSIESFIGSIDVFHSSDWTQPKTQAKKVTTYHDLIPIKYPDWSDPKIVNVHKRRLKLVEQEIDMVIAVSESTKDDLCKASKIPANKIKVIYEGVSENFKPQDPLKVQEFKNRLGLPDRFVLAIGGIGSRRNTARILEATAGLPLVLTGRDVDPRTVPDQDMPMLYASADLLLYPSLYEGFGLPVLEAMAVGTPVITSNVSSLPEVAGDAALLVSPDSLTQIKKALDDIWQDQEHREVLIKKGFKQAAKFSWQDCAEKTAQVYKEVLKIS